MKRLIVSLFLSSACFLLPSAANAVTLTPTASPSAKPTSKPTENPSAITELKERIASRVAQLRLVEKRGTMGEVTNVTLTQITLSDLRRNIRFVDIDELTKFSSPSANPPAGGSFGISDITKGTMLGVTGLYNKQSRRIMARFIEVASPPLTIHGVVEAVDAKEFTIRVVTREGKTFTVDVQTTTKTQVYTKDTGLTRSGFSKIKEGQRISVVGYKAAKEQTRITPSRILLLPDVPKDPAIKLTISPSPEPSPTATASPSPTTPRVRKTTPTP